MGYRGLSSGSLFETQCTNKEGIMRICCRGCKCSQLSNAVHGNTFLFQQDSLSACDAKKTVQLMHCHMLQFMSPSNSVDCHVGRDGVECVYIHLQ